MSMEGLPPWQKAASPCSRSGAFVLGSAQAVPPRRGSSKGHASKTQIHHTQYNRVLEELRAPGGQVRGDDSVLDYLITAEKWEGAW